MEKGGVDPALFVEILNNGPIKNAYHEPWLQKMGKRDYQPVAFSIEGMYKDVSLIAEVI